MNDSDFLGYYKSQNPSVNYFSQTVVSSGHDNALMPKYSENRAVELLLSGRKNNLNIIKYGSDNQHPNYLCELPLKSGLHRTILIAKSELVAGEDVVFIGEDADDAKEWFNEVGLDETREPIAYDLVTYSGFAIQNIYSFDIEKKSDGTRKLESVHKEDFKEFRLTTPEQLKSGIYKPLECKLHPVWGRSPRKAQIKTLPLWFPEGDKNYPKKKGKNFIYYDRVHTNILKWYPLPDYESQSCMNAIELDAELIMFDVKELENNLNTGYVVTFLRKDYSSIDPKKERELRSMEESLVRQDMTGAKNNKNVVVLRAEPPKANENVKTPMTITPVPSNNNSERHTILERRKNINILIGHGLPDPAIAGIPDLTKSGFASEAAKMEAATSIWFFTRINSFRRPMRRYYLKMAKEAGFNVTDCKIIDSIPFRARMTEKLMLATMGTNEIRADYGKSAASDEVIAEIKERTPSSNNKIESDE